MNSLAETTPAGNNIDVTAAGWRAVAVAIQSHTSLSLKQVYGLELTGHDDTVPDTVKANNNLSYDNRAILSYYRKVCHPRQRLSVLKGLVVATGRHGGVEKETPLPITK